MNTGVKTRNQTKQDHNLINLRLMYQKAFIMQQTPNNLVSHRESFANYFTSIRPEDSRADAYRVWNNVAAGRGFFDRE
jgi:hypothetical protein